LVWTHAADRLATTLDKTAWQHSFSSEQGRNDKMDTSAALTKRSFYREKAWEKFPPENAFLNAKFRDNLFRILMLRRALPAHDEDAQKP
jgi:hypothetical protein